MEDIITLNAELGNGEDVTITKVTETDGSIHETLDQIRRFLRAIGYEWVDVVSVTGTDDEGNVITHHSNLVTEIEDFDTEGCA